MNKKDEETYLIQEKEKLYTKNHDDIYIDKKNQYYLLRKKQVQSIIQTNGIDATFLRHSYLLDFNHPNFVKYFGMDLYFPCQQLPKCKNSTLFQLVEYLPIHLEFWLQKHQNENILTNRLTFLYHILQGINFLHHNHLFHGQIHPKNIFIDEDKKHAKIGDLQDMYLAGKGLNKDYIDFYSPEFLLDYQNVHMENDIWAFGVLCIYVLTGKRPFYNSKPHWFFGLTKETSQKNTLNEIWKWMGTPNTAWRNLYVPNQEWPFQAKETCPFGQRIEDNYKYTWDDFGKQFGYQVWEKIKDFTNQCLRLEPKRRITAAKALKHPLFKKAKKLKTKGSWSKVPKYIQPTDKMIFKIRKELVKQTYQDVKRDIMDFYVALLTIQLFDRSYPFWSDLWSNDQKKLGELDIQTVRHIFGACYFIALKSLGKVNDYTGFADLGMLIPDVDTIHVQKNIMKWERWIIKQLKFRFYAKNIYKRKKNLNLIK